MPRKASLVIALAAVAALSAAAGAQAAVSRTLIASDPFTNAESQHATIVEPDSFAFGSTIVTAGQSGRYYDGGSSGIRYATSTTGGASWTQSTLPGLTVHDANGGTYDRATDPAVAYDAAHGTWLVSTLGLVEDAAGNPSGAAVLTSRSTDGGVTFGAPVPTAVATGTHDYDKNWIACDNRPASPFYGHCYTTWDDHGDGNRLLSSTSTDGGLTWGSALRTADAATGLGGQPVVQPNGTVVVPAANANESAIIAYRSTDGGASWSSASTVATVADHLPAGSLRSGPLPSAEIDAAGRVYVVWQDCRFRRGCKSNDIVLSTSTTGSTWTSPVRVPIDAASSSVDHFIPGLGVDPGTSGATARLGLTYYAYANARCGTACALQVGYIQSNDGGAHWGSPVAVADPFPLTDVPDTSQGRMVGDYISTSWLGGKAFAPVAIARPHAGTVFSQGLEVPTGGIVAGGGAVAAASGQAVPKAASDHAAARSALTQR
ncbi:MAG: glycoside hydrolase [Actinomycetota bacterium]|nr:glycoside hydrolase [Actinomycetota bacterium]